jgi:hypothetical protein
MTMEKKKVACVHRQNISQYDSGERCGPWASCLKGRFIGENIRLIYDIMENKEFIQIPGLLILIDFEKVFYTICWNFIYEALYFYFYF